jgi:hypothetical protein
LRAAVVYPKEETAMAVDPDEMPSTPRRNRFLWLVTAVTATLCLSLVLVAVLAIPASDAGWMYGPTARYQCPPAFAAACAAAARSKPQSKQ